MLTYQGKVVKVGEPTQVKTKRGPTTKRVYHLLDEAEPTAVYQWTDWNGKGQPLEVGEEIVIAVTGLRPWQGTLQLDGRLLEGNGARGPS